MSGNAGFHLNGTAGIINRGTNFIMQQQVTVLFETAVLSDIYLFPLS